VCVCVFVCVLCLSIPFSKTITTKRQGAEKEGLNEFKVDVIISVTFSLFYSLHIFSCKKRKKKKNNVKKEKTQQQKLRKVNSAPSIYFLKARVIVIFHVWIQLKIFKNK